MRIEIDDEVGQDVLTADEIERLVAHVLGGEGAPDATEVSVSFVSRERIHELNRDYRGIDRPTDVLSFNIDDPDEDDDFCGVFDADEPDDAGDSDGAGDEQGAVPDTDDSDDAGGPDDEDDELWEMPDEGCPTGEDDPTADVLMLGDVILCPEIVVAQAPEFGNAPADEMRLLLTHGCLHLMGYDHEDPAEAEEMEALERRYLAAFADAPADELNVGPTVDHAAEGSVAWQGSGAAGRGATAPSADAPDTCTPPAEPDAGPQECDLR